MPWKTFGELIYDPHGERGLVKIDWDKLPDNMKSLQIINDWISSLEETYRAEIPRLIKEQLKRESEEDNG